MADLQKTIEIIFSGVDELSGPMSSMAGKISGFSDKVEAFAQPFSDAADGIIKMDLALATLAGGSIALAIKEAGNFESAMAEVNTILDLGSGELDTYSNDVLDYARQSTQSIDTITDALYNAASLGVSYADSLDVLTIAERLAVGTKTDLNSALEILVGTMNAYGAPMSEMGDYSDAFFTIIKDGKTTLPELEQSISNVTGIASSAGIDFETLGAAISGLTAAGAPTSQAITQIKSAIQALAAPTPAASKAAEELGISLGSAAIESKGLPGVLQEIYEATGGNVEEMRKLVPSIEGMQAALILGEDASGIFAKAMDDMANNAGAADKAFDQMKNNLDLVWQNMLSSVKAMVIEFGREIEGGGALVGSVGKLFDGISEGVDAGAFDPILDMINEFIDDADELISGIAKDLPKALEGVDFSGFVDAMGGLGDAIGGWFDSVDFTTPEGLENVIQDIVNAGQKLVEVSTGMAEAFDPYIQAVLGFIRSTGDMESAAAEDFGKLLGHARAIITFGAEVAGAILIIGEGAAKLGPAFTGVGNAIGSLLDIIQGAFHLVVSGIAGFFEDLLQAAELVTFGDLGEEITDMRQKMTDLKNSSLDSFASMGKEVKNYAGEFDLIPSHKETELKAEGDTEAVGQYVDDLELIPSHKETDIEARVEQAEFDTYYEKLSSMPAAYQTVVTALINSGDFETLEGFLANIDDEEYVANVIASLDPETQEKVKADLAKLEEEKKPAVKPEMEEPAFSEVKKKTDELSGAKMMEIQLEGNIKKELAQIENDARTTQSAFEWTAKVEIANAQYEAEKVVSAFNAAHEAVSATANAASSMFDSLLGNWEKLNNFDKSDLMAMVRAQMDMEKDALENQKKLTDAQIDLMNKKADALASGEGLIKIESDGLEPALEMIMWEILQKVQLRVAEESSEFLLGLGTGI